MSQLLNTSLFNDANLQSYYRLESVADSKGANTLTNNNTVTFVPAKFDNGADFTNANTNKSLSTTNTLSIDGGACSFTFWIKPYNLTGTQIPFSHGNNTSDVREFMEITSTTLTFTRDKTGSASQNFAAAFVLPSTSFTHIVWSYNATTLIGYVNGVSVGSVAASGNGATDPGNGFHIGNLLTAGTEFTNAIIDDFGIFNRALTPSEVAILYNSGGGFFFA